MSSYQEMVEKIADAWTADCTNFGTPAFDETLEDDTDFKDFCDDNMDVEVSIQKVIEESRVLEDMWYNFLTEVQSYVHEDVINELRNRS